MSVWVKKKPLSYATKSVPTAEMGVGEVDNQAHSGTLLAEQMDLEDMSYETMAQVRDTYSDGTIDHLR